MFTMLGIGHFLRRILPVSLEQLDIYPDHKSGAYFAKFQADTFVSDLADFMGGYKTLFEGSGFEYSDTVEYQYGDDIRRIDWNQSAKYGDLWVKQYQEERGREVLFLVDVSASMTVSLAEIGSQHFFEVLALLGLASIEMKDRLGLITFSDKVRSLSRPSGDRSIVSQVLDKILCDLKQNTLNGRSFSSVTDALETARRVLKGRSVIFIVSDFINLDGMERIGELTQAHQIVFVRLKTDRKKLLRSKGILEARDSENHESTVVDLSDTQTRLQMDNFIDEQLNKYQKIMIRSNISELLIESDLDPKESISSFFRKTINIRRASS